MEATKAMVKFYPNAMAVREALPEFEDQLDYQKKLVALKTYWKDNECAIAELEAEAALADTLDEAVVKGDVSCDREHQGNYALSLQGKDTQINGNTVTRWRKVRDIPEETRRRYYDTAIAADERVTREGLFRFVLPAAADEVEAPSGKYSVIVCDPPWAMKKIDRAERPNQTEFDYTTMSQAELLEFEVVAESAANNCHLFLWTTHKFLPDALAICDKWGFRYVLTMVWHKPGGFQPVGLPQYNCEFCIYSRKGSPKFTDTKDFPVCFEAPRGAHSEKPEEFYDTIRRVTAGRRLDVFSRREIEGFKGWGNELR